MALLWVDGFDSYGTTDVPSPSGIMARKYTSIASEGSFSIQSGRLGDYAVKMTNLALSFGPGNITTDSTLILGFAIKFASLTPQSASIGNVVFFDGATEGVNFHFTALGEIEVYCGGSYLDSTSGLGLTAGVWYYFEFKVVCNTSGSYAINVNGLSKLTGSGDTKAGANDYHTTFLLRGDSSQQPIYDDLYCADSTGTANNDLLGNMRVETIRPSANGSSMQWTPDTGNNYARVQEGVCDDNTSYVEDGTTGHKDLYTYANLSGITAGILGVRINTDAEATDVSNTTLIDKCSSNGTESNGSQSLTVNSYTTLGRILEIDPDTTNAWTISGLNAAEFGVEVG